jgi:hypothetical protein
VEIEAVLRGKSNEISRGAPVEISLEKIWSSCGDIPGEILKLL